MKPFSHITVLVVIFLFVISVGYAFAQEERPEEPAAEVAKVEPAAPVEKELAEPVENAGQHDLPVGWFVLMARIGGGSPGAGGELTFEEAPEEYDEESYFTANNGNLRFAAVDALFFPTNGRRFMLSASLMSMWGQAAMSFDSDEYGHELGLDNRVMHYEMSYLMGGIGYRFLYGNRLHHGSTLHFKLGFGGGDMSIDGWTQKTGGSGIIEFGGSYFYRMDAGILFGAQMDLRGYGASYFEMEVQDIEDEPDMSLGGGGVFLSFVVGFEP